MYSSTGFDVRPLAAKLRRAAAELRAEKRRDLATEQFARRLEAHAEAMLHPEAALRDRFLARWENRLEGRAVR